MLHAPRQVGKTTFLLSLGASLTAAGRYAAVMATMDTGAPFDDITRAAGPLLDTWRQSAEAWLPRVSLPC